MPKSEGEFFVVFGSDDSHTQPTGEQYRKACTSNEACGQRAWVVNAEGGGLLGERVLATILFKA